jgi:hypothetical protein
MRLGDLRSKLVGVKTRLWRRSIALIVVLSLNCIIAFVAAELRWGTTLAVVTMWGIQVPVAIIGGIMLVKVSVKIKRINKGLCYRCGYDLRATPERCPECGAVPITN